MTAYRNDLDALSTRHSALANELAEKTQELADATRILEEARAKAKRAVLDNIGVATPCLMDWEAMTGDERVRACDACNKNVFNLSGLTREEAEALIIEKNGDLCVRYFQRHDGTILLQDCSIGVTQKRKRKVLAVGATLLLGGAALFAWKVSRKGAPTADVCNSHVMVSEPPQTWEPSARNATHDDPPPPEVDPVHSIRGQLIVPVEPPPVKLMGAMVLHRDPPVKKLATEE